VILVILSIIEQTLEEKYLQKFGADRIFELAKKERQNSRCAFVDWSVDSSTRRCR
jgi:hypothetical protein